MQQTMRTLTMGEDGAVDAPHILICDRRSEVERRRATSTPGRGNPRRVHYQPRAQCERVYRRFVRSIREECLGRLIPLGDRHFSRPVAEYVEHYHDELRLLSLQGGARYIWLSGCRVNSRKIGTDFSQKCPAHQPRTIKRASASTARPLQLFQLLRKCAKRD
jgi:hypothetical protein